MIRIVAIVGGLLLSIAWAAGNGYVALLATTAYGLVMACIGLAPIRTGFRRLTDAALGITPAAPRTTPPPAPPSGGGGSAVAHRSEPLDQLSLTITPEQAQRIAREATTALPSPAFPLALPAPSALPVIDAATITRQMLDVLPDRVPWNLQHAKIEAIPLLTDGSGWGEFNLYGNEDLVVCGAKRKGKGNAIQLLTLTALAFGPELIQVWYLDAKQGLDYSFARRMFHARLYAEIRDASGALLSDGTLLDGFDAAITEMERRNAAMYGIARNIHEFAAKTGTRWPMLILVVDEAADLDSEQKCRLNRLARMGGAAGLLIITCTQYPTADVLSSQVQANAVNRLVFQLTSEKYTAVAMGLPPGGKSRYEPAAITMPGVAVFRSGDGERLGRVPEVTDRERDAVIKQIVARWARNVSSVPGSTQLPEAPLSGSEKKDTILVLPDMDATIPVGGVVPSGMDKMTKLRTLVAMGVSSNAIIEAVGGNRNDMLKIIGMIKEGKL